MPRRDESGPPVAIDDAALDRLRATLDHDDVAAAYLFGSQARGAAGPLSDVDIAVWSAPTLSPRARFSLRLRLLEAAEQALDTDEIDLIVLDDAPPLLRHRAWRDGVLIVDRDPRTRVRGEASTLVEYLDTKPLREQMAAGVRRRLEENSFGRR